VGALMRDAPPTPVAGPTLLLFDHFSAEGTSVSSVLSTESDDRTMQQTPAVRPVLCAERQLGPSRRGEVRRSGSTPRRSTSLPPELLSSFSGPLDGQRHGPSEVQGSGHSDGCEVAVRRLTCMFTVEPAWSSTHILL
jgi:hypothetical protein